jgi:hypothetical protein
MRKVFSRVMVNVWLMRPRRMMPVRPSDIVMQMSVDGEVGGDPQQVGPVVAALHDLADRLPQDVLPEAVRDLAQPGHLIVKHLAPDLDFPDKWISRHLATQPGGAYAKMIRFPCGRP